MEKYKNIIKNVKNDRFAYIISGVLCGILWFGLLWGWNTLDITNVDWLKVGDRATHFFGWIMYKNSAWHFPIGLIDGITYPYQLSVTYTDSIPLFALFFKLIQGFLPEIFQYFGIWGLCCLIMEGIIISLITFRFRSGIFCNLLITSMCILQLCMITRMFNHTALAGQWIILLAIYIWINKEYFSTRLRKVIGWSATVILASLIHIYFIPMVVVIMCGSLFEDFLKNSEKLWENIGILFVSSLCGLLTLYCMGAFYGETVLDGGGLGYYCLNLNTLINSRGYSKIVKELPLAIDGQYEGFAYLGLGGIVLVICAVMAYLTSKNKSSVFDLKRAFSLFIVVFTLIVLGMGTVASFNDTIFFTWRYPGFVKRIVGLFRSSGRMIWPVVYLIVLGSAIVFLKYINRKIAIILLIVCTSLQVYDFSGALSYGNHANLYKNEYIGLVDGIWENIAQSGFKHIQFCDTIDYNKQIAFADYAINHDMTISDFQTSRKDNLGIYKYSQDIINGLVNGKADGDTIYVFSEFPRVANDLYLYFCADENLWVVSSVEINYEEYVKRTIKKNSLKFNG